MSTPAISILMTVYNAEVHLDAAIEGILDQTFRDFEFLIVDDASTDRSVELARSWAEKDARIRLITNETNKGQTPCLNQGLRLASADWIARQDADDFSLPKRLQKQWDAVQRNPSLSVLGVNGWIVNEAGVPDGMIHAPLRDLGIRWSLPFRNPFIHTGVMFRRLLPDGSPALYDEQYRICQDWDLWDRLLLHGQGINLPERLVIYRHQTGSLSHRFSDRTREECARIVAAIWERHFPTVVLGEKQSNLLQSFREGLTPKDRKPFWAMYHALKEFGQPDAQAEALHHIQAAGALLSSSRGPAAGEILAATRLDPAWTGNVFKEHFFLSTSQERNFLSKKQKTS